MGGRSEYAHFSSTWMLCCMPMVHYAGKRLQAERVRTLNHQGVEIPGSPSASSSRGTSRTTGLFWAVVLFGRQNRPVAVLTLESTSRNGRGFAPRDKLGFFSCVGEVELFDTLSSFTSSPSCAAQFDGRPLRLYPGGCCGARSHEVTSETYLSSTWTLCCVAP